MIQRFTRTVAAAALLMLAFVLTACGSDSASGSDDKASAPTKLTVAVSPGAATSTPMYLAIKNGVFKKLGLELELKVLEDGSVAVPNTLNGQTQFSMSGFGPAASAIEKGLKIKIIGAANVLPNNPDSKYQAIVVNKKAGITSVKDIKTWAADTTEVDPSHAYTVDTLGGDYESIKRVAVPFPSIGDAVADGTVDAALLNEPWLTGALETGKVEVLSYVNGDLTKPGAPGAVFIGSDRYMKEHPEVTAKFIQGIQEAYQYAYDHPQEVADFVPQSGLNDQVPPVIALGEYQRGPLQASQVKPLLDVFAKYGGIEGSVPAEDMLYQP
jgi:NitT/TauT family transport system substrate-binding protein